MAVLTNPAYYALTGPHAELADVRGRVRRYQPEVAPFLGLPDEPDEQDWADAAELLGDGHTAALMRPDLPLPASIKLVQQFGLVQLVAPDSFGAEDTEAVVLGPDDVPEMVVLTALTDPGPFRTRTIECGRYLGLRRDGELIAMAGERQRLPAAPGRCRRHRAVRRPPAPAHRRHQHVRHPLVRSPGLHDQQPDGRHDRRGRLTTSASPSGLRRWSGTSQSSAG